jgi:hypothetical protein
MKKSSLLLIVMMCFARVGFGQAFEPPKFPTCKCAEYNVSAGIKGKPLSVVNTQNAPIVINQDEILAINASLNCTPSPTGNNCASERAWEIVDVTNGANTVVKAWTLQGFPTEIDLKTLKCDKSYALVLQGRCGCTLCDPFVLNFMVKCKDCCDDLKAPIITTTSPSFFCLGKPCDQIFSYSIQDYPNTCPVKFQWTVTSESSGGINLSSANTSKTSFNCSALKPGVYTISVTVFCKSKQLTSSTKLTVCEKPSPNFSQMSDGSDVTFNAVWGGENYWMLYEDNDNSCLVSTGDKPHQYNDWKTPVQQVYNGLQAGKSYIIVHYAVNRCGADGRQLCYSLKSMCFKWFPAMMSKQSPNTPQSPTSSAQNGLQKISEKEMNISEMPASMLKSLPISKELLQMKEAQKVEGMIKD